jgi:excisionase family DNA binding protein
MNRIIEIGNIHSNTMRGDSTSVPSTSSDSTDLYRITLDVLVKNNPHKITFTLKEAAALLNVGEEFIRRRMKSGAISATYFGDKPMIHITELTRISLNGV